VLILQDALPSIKTFLAPLNLKHQARDLTIRCVIAFLMHLGKMSAARVSGAVRTEARHRAQISRFLGRAYWRRGDQLGRLRAALLEWESRQGLNILILDQTLCGQQGKLTQNTFTHGIKTQRANRSQGRRRRKTFAVRSCHCFVMGLLITPSGLRVPFSSSYYTADYCKQNAIDYRTQTEVAAQIIRELPVSEATPVVVLGDTAFDAQVIHSACQQRRFRWIVPINPQRVLAGSKPRPQVSSLCQELTADQMVRLEVHPGQGKYVVYRRLSPYRIGPKLTPRTFYVHEKSREVHSVGMVRLVFSTTKTPAPGHRLDVQKILMTNDQSLTMREVIELYGLRWQIELFFKELKSTLGLHHYRFREFHKVSTWVQLCLATFVYLEWLRARTLSRKTLEKTKRKQLEAQRTYGLAQAVRQTAEQRELKQLGAALQTPGGQKRLARLLKNAHQKEYRFLI